MRMFLKTERLRRQHSFFLPVSVRRSYRVLPSVMMSNGIQSGVSILNAKLSQNVVVILPLWDLADDDTLKKIWPAYWDDDTLVQSWREAIFLLKKCDHVGKQVAINVIRAFMSGGRFNHARDIVDRVYNVGDKLCKNILSTFSSVSAKIHDVEADVPEPALEPIVISPELATVEVPQGDDIRVVFWNVKKLSSGGKHYRYKLFAIVEIMKKRLCGTDIFFLQEVVGNGGGMAIKDIVEALGTDDYGFKISGYAHENEQYAVIWNKRLGEPNVETLYAKKELSPEDIRKFLFPEAVRTPPEQCPYDRHCSECLAKFKTSLQDQDLDPGKPDHPWETNFKLVRPIWRVSFGRDNYLVHHSSTENRQNKRELLLMKSLIDCFNTVDTRSESRLTTGGDTNISQARNLEWIRESFIESYFQLKFPLEISHKGIRCHEGENYTNWWNQSNSLRFHKLPSFNDQVLRSPPSTEGSEDVASVEVLTVDENFAEWLFGLLNAIEEATKCLNFELNQILDHKPIMVSQRFLPP